jgi:hypothetical protein
MQDLSQEVYSHTANQEILPHYMGCEGSVLCSQETAIIPYIDTVLIEFT